MEVEQIEENEESGELELNPIKVPQYLIDIYNFITPVNNCQLFFQ